MYATTNSNDASNEQLTRLRNIVWLWCILEGYPQEYRYLIFDCLLRYRECIHHPQYQ